MIVFYAPDLLESGRLSEADSLHAVRVLRHHEGDVIRVADGRGTWYDCQITEADARSCGVEVLREEKEATWGYQVEIAVSPTKNMERMEWLMEKAVEIGINRFVPLCCHNSERREMKIDRLQRIALSAMKQSLKATLPVIEPITPFDNYVSRPFMGQSFIAHCKKDDEKKYLSHLIAKNCNVRVLIGPEGDFSQDEIDKAFGCGFLPVSLGERRLRTETASLVALHTAHLVNEL